jgi:hypothetical protein
MRAYIGLCYWGIGCMGEGASAPSGICRNKFDSQGLRLDIDLAVELAFEDLNISRAFG